MASLTVPALQRSGDVTSPAIAWPAGSAGITLQVVMPIEAERADPSKAVDLAIEFSKDDGTTWKAYVMARWHGQHGARSKDGTRHSAPHVSTSGPRGAALARVHLTLAAPMTLGAELVIT